MRLLIFLKSTSSRSRPLGLRCAKIELSFLLNGKVVIIPWYCIGASSTVKFSFRFMGHGRLCVYAVWSFLFVSFNSYLSFTPMSSRCLAKISLNSTSVSSMWVLSWVSSCESSHLKLERKYFTPKKGNPRQARRNVFHELFKSISS